MAGSLAQDAMQYQGKGYVYGGAPAAGPGNWDCSSFVNWCLGHDLGHAIPGFTAGSYTGKSHGPVVLDYATWSGAQTVSGPPQASDLCVWAGVGATGHIGIAISPQTMISALNHVKGTTVTPIAGYGPAGVPVVYRRVTGTGGGFSLPSGCIPGMGLIYLLVMRWRHDGKSRVRTARTVRRQVPAGGTRTR